MFYVIFILIKASEEFSLSFTSGQLLFNFDKADTVVINVIPFICSKVIKR